MDVGLLMRDKGVEELESLQTQLQTQVEQQREGLREMVGRRYRDVLDASSEVRTVHSLAESLVSALAASRSTTVPAESLAPSRGGAADVQRFLLLHSLLPRIGNDDDWDALNDAYALCLAEHLHRSLSASTIHNKLSSLLPSISRRLVLTRRLLVDDLIEGLSCCNRSDWAANQLAGVALVQGWGVEELMDSLLNARKNVIASELEQSRSLLSIVKEVKATLKVVEDLFSHGEMLRVLQSMGATSFRPQVIFHLEQDSAFFSISHLLSQEAESVNRIQRERKIGTVLTQKINDKCAQWMEEICSLARPSIESIVSYYESLDDIIEFLHALGEVLAEGWPRLGATSSSIFYDKLFGGIVVDKFKSLVSSSVHSLSSSFSSSLPSLSSIAPTPLFDKRPAKFDQLLAVGVSQSLHDAVHSLFTGITSLRETCSRFEKALQEGGSSLGPSSSTATVSADSVRDTLADEVVAMMERLASCVPPSSSVSQSERLLWTARVGLSLLHADPPAICKVLNRDGYRISRCSAVLHKNIEDSLTSFVENEVSSLLSLEGGPLAEFVLSTHTSLRSVDLALEWEGILLPEVGKVDVPVCISSLVHSTLFELATRCSSSSVSHLLSRKVRQRVATRVGESLINVYKEAIGKDVSRLPQRTLLQLLFDCRVLSSLFPFTNSNGVDAWRQLSSSLESCIDPFDFSLLTPLLSTNTKTALQRTQLTLSCLLLDVLPSRDSKSSSISLLIDLLPRASDDFRPRIPLIPRLDRQAAESAKTVIGSAKKKNALLASGEGGGMSSKPSLSSFYDKVVSSGWFGN